MLDNKNFIPYMNKCFALSNLGKNEEAIVEYDQAIELNPRYDAAHNNKGASLSALGKNEEAIVEYDQAIKIHRIPVHMIIKDIRYFYLEESVKPLNHPLCLLNLIERCPNAWYNRSVYYSHDNKIEESLLDLQKAITIDANYRNYALKDKDFDNKRNNIKFIEILNLK